MNKVDVKKVGILLIGISISIISLDLLYLFLKYEIFKSLEKKEEIYVYCENINGKNFIYIKNYGEKVIYNLDVLDLIENKTICHFNKIDKKSEEVCIDEIKSYRDINKVKKIYMVKIGDNKIKVVRCFKIIKREVYVG